MEDIVMNIDNNCYLFKKNVDYAQSKFLQASKMSKRLMGIFFSNPDFALMQK